MGKEERNGFDDVLQVLPTYLYCLEITNASNEIFNNFKRSSDLLLVYPFPSNKFSRDRRLFSSSNRVSFSSFAFLQSFIFDVAAPHLPIRYRSQIRFHELFLMIIFLAARDRQPLDQSFGPCKTFCPTLLLISRR